jgi:DNA polymerase-3 subunit chi
METQVTFWHVTDVKTKLALIASLVQRHFIHGERILVLVPNEAAARYVDGLLWSHPAEGFLPHAVSERPLNAAILITTTPQNLNQAQVLINLCPGMSPITQEFQHVHDLLDETDSAKHALATQRLATYQQAGYAVSRR